MANDDDDTPFPKPSEAEIARCNVQRLANIAAEKLAAHWNSRHGGEYQPIPSWAIAAYVEKAWDDPSLGFRSKLDLAVWLVEIAMTAQYRHSNPIDDREA